MTRWVPVLASVGLVSVMAMPAPGVWGLVIGVTCCLAIVLSVIVWLIDRAAADLALRWARRSKRRSGLQMHAASGMIRKHGLPEVPPAQAAAVVPVRPSPVEPRPSLAMQRRAARRHESYRLR